MRSKRPLRTMIFPRNSSCSIVVLTVIAMAGLGCFTVVETLLSVPPVPKKRSSSSNDGTSSCTAVYVAMDPFAMNSCGEEAMIHAERQDTKRKTKRLQPPLELVDWLALASAPLQKATQAARDHAEAFASQFIAVSSMHGGVDMVGQPSKTQSECATVDSPLALFFAPLLTASDSVVSQCAAFPALLLSPEQDQEEDSCAFTDQLLAEQGDWQAYFNNDAAQVYYFHVRTGASQWEPPTGFPAPVLTIPQRARCLARYHQIILASRHSDESSSDGDGDTGWNLLGTVVKGVSGLITAPPIKDPKKPNDDDDGNNDKKPWWLLMFDSKKGEPEATLFSSSDQNKLVERTAVNKGPTKYADVEEALLPYFVSGSQSEVLAQRDEHPPPVEGTAKAEESPLGEEPAVTTADTSPWDIFFRSDADTKNQPAKSERTYHYESENGEFATEDASPQPAGSLTRGGGIGAWFEDLPLFLTRDTSRTRPLFLSPRNLPIVGNWFQPSASELAAAEDAERLQGMEERRYAASKARQANLRKNYQEVVSDRSPTISLTSLKLKKSKDWFKYLGD